MRNIFYGVGPFYFSPETHRRKAMTPLLQQIWQANGGPDHPQPYTQQQDAADTYSRLAERVLVHNRDAVSVRTWATVICPICGHRERQSRSQTTPPILNRRPDTGELTWAEDVIVTCQQCKETCHAQAQFNPSGDEEIFVAQASMLGDKPRGTETLLGTQHEVSTAHGWRLHLRCVAEVRRTGRNREEGHYITTYWENGKENTWDTIDGIWKTVPKLTPPGALAATG